MKHFEDGQRVARIGVYGPADIEYHDNFWHMTVTMELGETSLVPWIKATNRKTAEVVMLNCAKCACIALLP